MSLDVKCRKWVVGVVCLVQILAGWRIIYTMWKVLVIMGSLALSDLTNIISWSNSDSIKLESASQTFFGCLTVYNLGHKQFLNMKLM